MSENTKTVAVFRGEPQTVAALAKTLQLVWGIPNVVRSESDSAMIEVDAPYAKRARKALQLHAGRWFPNSRGAVLTTLAALSLSAAACSAPAGGAATVPSAATSRDTTHFVVFSLTSHQARLQAMQPMGATRPAQLVSVTPDSLSHAVRVGSLVRRCLHPIASGRVITWCIDHKASGLR